VVAALPAGVMITAASSGRPGQRRDANDIVNLPYDGAVFRANDLERKHPTDRRLRQLAVPLDWNKTDQTWSRAPELRDATQDAA